MAKKKVNVTVDYKVKGADEVEGAFEGVSDSADDAAGSVDNLNNKTSETKGAAKSAQGGIKGLLQGFKAIVANPVGLVLVAIVGALKFVTSAINSSEESSNKLSQGFAFLSGLLQPLKDAFVTVFDAIVFVIEKPGEAWDAVVDAFDASVDFLKTVVFDPIKASFDIVVLGIERGVLKIREAWNELTGDAEELAEIQADLEKNSQDLASAQAKLVKEYIESSDAVSDAIDTVVDALEAQAQAALDSANAFLELEKREQALVKLRRDQSVANAKALRQLEELKIIRDDESKSLEERIKANEELAKKENTRINNAIALQKESIAITNERIRLEGNSSELLDQRAEQEIEYQELLNENAGIRAEQTVNDVALRVEAFEKTAGLIDQELELNAVLEEDAVKLADARVQAEVDKLAKLEELGLKENQRFRDQQAALLLSQREAEKARLDATKEANEKAADAQDKADAASLKQDKATAKLKADIQKELGGQLVGLSDSLVTALGEDSKTGLAIQKATALGEIAVDTARAISSLTAASSANPANAVTFGGAGAAQFAAGILQIGTNIASAYALLKQPAPQIDGGGSGGGNTAPSTTQTAPDLGFEGRTAGSEQFGSQVIRAFVTETDITTSQNTANNIQQLSQIG